MNNQPMYPSGPASIFSGLTRSRTVSSFRINQEVMTPVGRGVVQQPYSDGRALIRVPIGGSVKDSHCITPQAIDSSLWEYGPADCTLPES